MASKSLRSACASPVPLRLQLTSGKEVSKILQQMCGEISQSTTAEIVEIANSADSRSKLRDLMPIYFHSCQLQSEEAVITYLLLQYFILWRGCGESRRDRQVLEEHTEWLKGRVGELEEVREPDPEISRLNKQVQDLKTKNEKLQSAHDEMERQLEESNREICQLTAKLEKPQRTIEQKSQEVENENWCQLCHTPNDEAQHELSTTPKSQPVQNCCAMSVFVHGSLVYDSSSTACPVHQDVSPHTYNLQCVVTGL